MDLIYLQTHLNPVCSIQDFVRPISGQRLLENSGKNGKTEYLLGLYLILISSYDSGAEQTRVNVCDKPRRAIITSPLSLLAPLQTLYLPSCVLKYTNGAFKNVFFCTYKADVAFTNKGLQILKLQFQIWEAETKKKIKSVKLNWIIEIKKK